MCCCLRTALAAAGALVAALRADRHVVNCVAGQPDAAEPLLASCGIDKTVKVSGDTCVPTQLCVYTAKAAQLFPVAHVERGGAGTW